MKTLLLSFGIMSIAGLALAQMKKAPSSPDATATTSIAGKTVTIKYASPSVRGRQIFGDGGLISHDPHYPVCLHVYGPVSYYECNYMTLAQCGESASGRAAQCVLNPYAAQGYAAPPLQHHRRHRYAE